MVPSFFSFFLLRLRPSSTEYRSRGRNGIVNQTSTYLVGKWQIVTDLSAVVSIDEISNSSQ